MIALRHTNLRLISRLLGMLLIIMACSMVLPIGVSVFYKDGSQYELILSTIAILLIGLLFRNILGHGANYELRERESFWITSAIWIVIPLAGTIPYLLTGTLTHFTDAAFESYSGFTTTGSSVIVDLDFVPKGVLIYRSISEWVGGLGLVLFVVALLKKLGVGSSQLYTAEFSGSLQRKLHPRMSTSVSRMWRLYLFLTLLLFAILVLLRNDVFTSFCVAISAVSTGGFLPSNGALQQMTDISLLVVAVFMLLSGINLALIYRLITGKGRMLWRDEEFRLFMSIFAVVTVVFTAAFFFNGDTLPHALGCSIFQVSSTMSTCGFYLTGAGSWPLVVKVIMFLLVIIGASAGSTGGGLKLKRLMILAKYVRNYFIRMLHPNAVLTVQISHEQIETSYINKIFAFVFLYLAFLVGGAFILTFTGISIPDALSLAAANIANLGPLPIAHSVGGVVNYAAIAPLAKWVLIVLMMVGRVEIFAIIAIFFPAYWKH